CAVAPAPGVFVGDDDAAGFPDGGGDGFPVVGAERAQVDDFGLDAVFALGARGGLEGAGNECAVGDDGDVGTGPGDGGFAEGDHVVGAGIGGAALGLAVAPLGREENQGEMG